MKQRNTIQKRLVLEAVAALLNHPTADDVYQRIAMNHPNVSRGTVYRNLNALVQCNTLLKISMPDAADRYDIDTHLHYHLKCKNCGEFLDIELPEMAEMLSKIEDKSGFLIDRFDLVFKGICADCREKQIVQDNTSKL